MQTAADLRNILERIDRRGYPAYKDTRGSYGFPGYVLSIDHVQGDPFAAPSKVSIHIKGKDAKFPEQLRKLPEGRIALADYLLRGFSQSVGKVSFQAKGSGKSGLMSVSRPGQEVLERTACQIDAASGDITLRMEIGFPANGRTVNSRELAKILFELLPGCVKRTLYYGALDAEKVRAVVELAEDQQYIRAHLKERGLVAFIANGAVLPRESGVSGKPMRDAVRFRSPKELEVEFELPHRGEISGMGIREGITLIVGGGYHGKSTLLKALETGVYPHIAGDGREFVVTEDTAVKIRAEDGRSIKKVDISMFIRNLPNGKDTKSFSTEDASGSTSQAANVVEGIEAGANTLLIDEDTSATNFMIRDELMQRVVHRDAEPIVPFIDRVDELYRKAGISTILVAGSSGSYFHKADCVIQMNRYEPFEITAAAKAAAAEFPLPEKSGEAGEDGAFLPEFTRKVRPDKLFSDERFKLKTTGLDTIYVDREAIDVRYVEQLVDNEQLAMLGYLLRCAQRHVFDGQKTLREAMEQLYAGISKKGMAAVTEGGYVPCGLAMPRVQEMFACVNRYRGLKV